MQPAGRAIHRCRDSRQAPGPIIAAPAVEPHTAALLDDLEPIAVQLRFVQPCVASGQSFGGHGIAGRDKTRTYNVHPTTYSVCKMLWLVRRQHSPDRLS